MEGMMDLHNFHVSPFALTIRKLSSGFSSFVTLGWEKDIFLLLPGGRERECVFIW
jgi:hypothetical protein